MHFMRPLISRNHFHRHPLAVKGRLIAGQSRINGLGDLGDEVGGMVALPDLVAKIKSLILAHGGATLANGIAKNTSLPAVIYAAATLYASGGTGDDGKAAWSSWKAQAEPAESNDNVSWVLARCINRWADGLIQAANTQIGSGVLLDAAASRCVYTLVDTTQQGTTWMGGTVTTSKLTNSQWGATLEVAFNAVAKGVTLGLLPFTYLDILIKAFCQPNPVSRRFPVWSPPYTGLVPNDPRATAFRTVLKQLGWTNVTKLWFSYTQQAWVEQNDAADAQDRALMGAITTLNFVSGKAIYDMVAEKARDYFAARAEAIAAIGQFKQMQSGPLAPNVPAEDAATMDAIRKQFASTDMSVNTVLAPLGLWPSETQAGLSFLGASQLIVGGVVAIGVMGMIVWAISLMTETSRSAAAQTKMTAAKILATVDEVKASCMRVYEASAKTPADEKAYQDCLLSTKELVKLIPDPPSGSDPLGLKYIAILGVVAIGGFIAWKQFGKKG